MREKNLIFRCADCQGKNISVEWSVMVYPNNLPETMSTGGGDWHDECYCEDCQDWCDYEQMEQLEIELPNIHKLKECPNQSSPSAATSAQSSSM